MTRIALAVGTVLFGATVIGCSSDTTVKTLDRPANEKCNSASPECEQWTKLAIKCDANMARRDEGYMGKLEPWCSDAEEYREKVTGIDLSSTPTDVSPVTESRLKDLDDKVAVAAEDTKALSEVQETQAAELTMLQANFLARSLAIDDLQRDYCGTSIVVCGVKQATDKTEALLLADETLKTLQAVFPKLVGRSKVTTT